MVGYPTEIAQPYITSQSKTNVKRQKEEFKTVLEECTYPVLLYRILNVGILHTDSSHYQI
jgi:hypothetical protein